MYATTCTGHYSPDPSTVANNPNDALVKPAAQYSRRAKFENGDMDSKVVLLLRRFSEHAECVKWISRYDNVMVVCIYLKLVFVYMHMSQPYVCNSILCVFGNIRYRHCILQLGLHLIN